MPIPKKFHFEFPLSSNENYSSPHFLAMKNSVYIALSTKESDMVLAEGRYTNRDEKRHSGRRGWRGNRKRKRERLFPRNLAAQRKMLAVSRWR